ncbi:MAG: nucleotide excision repair endonuclease [Acidobacteriota bacterium]|nr:nucleotide excision repair endonuclease [Acidobacteriota bacterium]MDH3784796.1 nucleotide excision repair endonuclease [Acidobacteriota bacterium]
MSNPQNQPLSFVAERAIRLLQQAPGPLTSLQLAEELLATRAPDEDSARELLKTAFGKDSRLIHDESGWRFAGDARRAGTPAAPASSDVDDMEPDRVLIFIHGTPRQPDGTPFLLRSVSALRLCGDDVVGACGGDTVAGPYGNRLRRAALDLLEGAVPIVHDSPGALSALDTWLGEPIASPISLRRMAQERIGLPAIHDLESLVERLGLAWHETSEPLEMTDTLDSCLQALRRPDESLYELQVAANGGAPPLDWSRFAFDREFLRRVPSTPGTYRFYDESGKLLYVGKSKNLHSRVGSYFRDEGRSRPKRVQELINGIHRIEYEATGSDLEAVLREAELIRTRQPSHNVQRVVHGGRSERHDKLRSILILEPAAAPWVLRGFLIRRGRLLDRVAIGPRGGGLKRIARILDDWYFSAPDGPTVPEGPDLDIELVVRWLAEHRDEIVAFDPRDLGSTEEVIERLNWFLANGTNDPDGSPIHTR